ncbi:MAG: hypothetical protein H0W70_10260 [Actinobacteria bacterium]|nr:hypothetical protein [Actinomycetota bacterium]
MRARLLRRLLACLSCPLCDAVVVRRGKHISWHFALGDMPEDASSPIYGLAGE